MKAFRLEGKYTWRGEEYPTVTTILGVISKPALVYWAGKVVAEEAVRRVQAGEPLDARELAGEPSRQRDKRGDIGSIVHSVLETLAAGGVVGLAQIPAEARSVAESIVAWFEDVKPKILVSEATVVREGAPRYAGTLDMVAEFDGKRMLLDVKTSKGVYREVALQLAAYRYADYIALASGETQEIPEVDECGVLHVTSMGAKLVPMEVGEREREAFLSAARLWEWVNDKG